MVKSWRIKMNDEKETRISTHTLRGGARGRLSIDIVDFDGDDVLDVLIRRGSQTFRIQRMAFLCTPAIIKLRFVS